MIASAISRRAFLQGTGALIVHFSLRQATPAAKSLQEPIDTKWSAEDQRADTPELDGWLRVNEDGTVTMFTGRVELGNGILTALAQIAAEELDIEFGQLDIISADTDLVPNQGITSATTTIGVAGIVIRQAAATARKAILEAASKQLDVGEDSLTIKNGVVSGADGDQPIMIGDLFGGKQFDRDLDLDAPVKNPADYTIVGQSVPRIDIPVKLTAAKDAYRENVHVDGMTYARILRAPAYGARLVSWDETVADMEGIIAVKHIAHPGDERLKRVEALATMPGDFLAVVAETENQALRAVQTLAESAKWDAGEGLPTTSDALYDWMLDNGEPVELIPNGNADTARPGYEELRAKFESHATSAAHTVRQSYRGPFISYGPIASSNALADVQDGHATIWSGTQWPHGSRWMVAQALGFESNDQVQIIGGSTSGLYGRRDHYDNEVDVEAAILSQAVGRPVRLQWSRADEFVWAQYRPAQAVEMEALLDESNQISGLSATVHTATRNGHPIAGIAVMALEDTLYNVHPLPMRAFDSGPILRTGFMRNVFSGYNMFALESMMDELADTAGEDPIEFRLRHLEDDRAIELLTAVRDQAGWNPSGGAGGTGMGVGFVYYTNASGPSSSYMAYIAEVEVDESTGDVRVKKFTCGIDPGLVINPDGVTNQVEGGVIQAMSWAMKEEVAFDEHIVTSHDWATYPILTFPEVPEIDVLVKSRPDKPAKGIGEPVTTPVAAAIANAIFDATGARIRQLPFTPDRVKAALDAR